jgi:hypothetical protein
LPDERSAARRGIVHALRRIEARDLVTASERESLVKRDEIDHPSDPTRRGAIETYRGLVLNEIIVNAL